MSWYTDIKTWIANNIRTNHQREITGAKMNTVLNNIVDEVENKVDKVEGKGLSTNDYTDTDKTKLASALQTETDPTVPSWAKQSTKPSYDYSEIGNTPDLSGFITKSVNDLANYYLKSETYTKTEVANLIAAINQFHYEIAASTSAVTNPQSNVLYLIGPVGSGSDKYEEYVYPDSTTGWVKIGDTSIDLSGYVTTSALNTALAAYTTTSDLTTLLSNKADKWIPSTAGNIAKLTAEGNLADGGILASEIVTYNNIASKADIVSNATSGHLAGLDSDGNLTDSGIAASDVATTSDIADKLDAPSTAGTSGQVLTSDGQGGQSWQTPQSGVSSYNELNDKPQINSVTLSGNKSASDLGLATAAQGKKADTAVQPTDGVAYVGEVAGSSSSADFNAQSDTVWNKAQILSSAQKTQARTNIDAQEVLVSGTNIKTINNESLLGSGNITIQGGGGGGEANVIESISINGTTQTVTSKNVDLPVPTSAEVYQIVSISQSAFNALTTKDSHTLYLIIS